jgi:hypothetical protein
MPEPRPVPQIPAVPEPGVLAYREVASLRQNDHVTLWTLAGTLELIVDENHAGDDASYLEAYAVGFERHTRARVIIQARDLLHHTYSLVPRWHDDQT